MAYRLAGYQPHYFPRLHYFARILNADVYTISDYVQYVRKHAFPGADGKRVRGVSYQAHTPIKTQEGTQLLDVPVRRGDGLAIKDAPLDYATPWQQKHVRALEINYRKSPRFGQVFPEVEALLTRPYATLGELTVASTLWSLATIVEAESMSREHIHEALARTGFRLRRIEILSETPIPPPDKSSGRDADTWIIDTCRHFGADEYYFGGTGASAYMQFDRYRDAGITLIQQEWKLAPYRQLHAETFVPNLSILDALFNAPPESVRALLATPNQ